MANTSKSTSAAAVKKKAAPAVENRRIKIRVSLKSNSGEGIKPEVNVVEFMETGDNSASTFPAMEKVKIGKRKRPVHVDVVKPEKEERKVEVRFLLEPLHKQEAKKRWPNRYRANTQIQNTLPQYPLPTHEVKPRRGTPIEFELNKVVYEQGHAVNLKDALFLRDALFDLPEVENNEARDEMPYSSEPETEFQRFIRLQRGEMPGSSTINSIPTEHILYDHQPYHMNDDDHQRACLIPKKKGANFRDLPGVKVDDNNKLYFDPKVPRVYFKSGKPLVPNYAMSYKGGISLKPFGRLSWDETISTVVTRADPHNQALLHPLQDRVLTIRENARLQGFPDYYKLGKIKDRYIQVVNAVAIPVARALGYSLALALKGLPAGEGSLLTLPKQYPMIQDVPEQVVDMI